MQRENLLTLFLILMAMVSPVALNIVAPIMPLLADEFSASGNVIQLSFTLYLATLAIGQLFGGPIADRYGKRPLLLAGFGLHILGGLVGIIASNVELILLSRIMQAAGGCIGMMLARSILVDLYPSDKAVEKLSYITMGVATAQAIAPTIGGFATELFGWHSVFYLPMLMALIVWAGVLLQYPCAMSSEKSSANRSFFATYRQLLGNRLYLKLSVSSTLIACGFFSFVTCAPFITSSEISPDLAVYGFWFLFVALGFMAGSFINARLISRFTHVQMIFAGHALSLLGALLMLLSLWLSEISYAGLFLTMTLFTFGRGISQPHLQSLSISAVPENRASASGLLGFIQLLLGALIAQLVAASVQTLGFMMLPLYLLLFAIIALLLYHASQQSETQQHSLTTGSQ
jgi:DHA1 family bicyclomycin/chloramphenicol resistance-like MFS transporter